MANSYLTLANFELHLYYLEHWLQQNLPLLERQFEKSLARELQHPTHEAKLQEHSPNDIPRSIVLRFESYQPHRDRAPHSRSVLFYRLAG